MCNQFFTSQIDWLDAWDLFGIDVDRIKKIRKRATKTGEVSPFTIRIATGDVDDQAVNTCERGISIDVFSSDRMINDHPIATIRVPWDTAKMIGQFLNNLPPNDPESSDGEMRLKSGVNTKKQ
jgi:sporulation protein YlmC with PRC-barrel domain